MLSYDNCPDNVPCMPVKTKTYDTIGTCVNCNTEKKIVSRYLCENCYAKIKRSGELEKFPRRNQSKVSECHPDRKHFADGLCNACYKRIRYMDSEKRDRRRHLDRKRRSYIYSAYKRELRNFLAENPDSVPTKEQIDNLIVGKTCVYCNKRNAETVDHVIPLCRGGTYTLDNLVGACRLCNSSKGSKLISEWDGYDVYPVFQMPTTPTLDGKPIVSEPDELALYLGESIPTLINIGLLDALLEVEKVLAWNETDKHPGAKWKSKTIGYHDSKAISHLHWSQCGVMEDYETGCSHRAHAACRLLMSLALELNSNKKQLSTS